MESNSIGRGFVPAAIEQRLEKLEKANRRLTLVSVALGAMLVLFFVLAATKPTPDTLRVKELEVVDDAGKTRIMLGVGTMQGLYAFTDQNGKKHVGLRSDMHDTFPGVWLFDQDGKTRAWLSVFSSGGAESGFVTPLVMFAHASRVSPPTPQATYIAETAKSPGRPRIPEAGIGRTALQSFERRSGFRRMMEQ